MSEPRSRPPLWLRLAVVVASPLVFLIVAEGVVRVSGVETDLARNRNFEIEVPVWLLADPGWVDIQHERMQRPQGVRAEDVVWLQHFEEARFIQYKMRPNVDVLAVNPFNEWEVAQGVTFRLQSNAAGFRDRPFAPRTPTAGRIVSLGDSSTFGWGVDPEYTYQRLLEERFRRSSVRRVEVLNLGIPGHTSAHGMRMLQHYARALDPDLLIISFGANDARYGSVPAEVLLAPDETAFGALRFLLLRFDAFKLLRRAIVSVRDPFLRAAQADASADSQPVVRSVPHEEYRENLRRMIDVARQDNVPAVLLAVCAGDDYTRVMWEVAEETGMPMVNGLQLFSDAVLDVRDGRLYPDERAFHERIYGAENMRQNLRFMVTNDGCHPNRVGHNLLADALLDAVIRVLD